MQYINLRFQKLSAAQASQNAFHAERHKDIHLKNMQDFETASGAKPYLKSTDKNKYLNTAPGTRTFHCILEVTGHL